MIYAWGWHPSYSAMDRNKLPDLKLVQYPTNYDRARQGDIAYVNSMADVKRLVAEPYRWRMAILGDEHNLRTTVDKYNEEYEEREQVLKAAGIPVVSSAIGMERLGDFDHEWVQGNIIGDIQGVNIMPTQYKTFLKESAKYPDKKWFVTLIPVRPVWFPLKHNTILRYLYESITTNWITQAKELLRSPNVAGVGVWCFKEGKLNATEYQSWHGLLDRYGNLTRLGHQINHVILPTGD